MAIPRPIDIKVLPADEGWLNELFPNRGKANLSSKAIGIEFPNDNDSIIIEDFDWKTIRGKQILIRKGNPGALNGNDMRKINIAVKAAIANPDDAHFIRYDLVESYMPKGADRKLKGTILGGMEDWIESPSGVEATNLAITNNVMKGRKRHAGLSPNQLKTAIKYENDNDPFPPSNMLKAVNVKVVFNKGMAKEKFGDKPFSVYRGIYGEQAIAIKAKAKKGDTIRMDSNTLTSWTTSLGIAKRFKSGPTKGKSGIVIESKISYKNVFDSFHSTGTLSGLSNEREVLVSPKGLKISGVIISD